jgi:N-acetylmuramic acid 6-phosphate etherase
MKRKNIPHISESENPASTGLDKKTSLQILRIINREDAKVALAIRKVLPQIARAVDLIVERLTLGGRLIYLGAGTSGRLGVLDASECMPTFGTDRVVGLIAGGPRALTHSTEDAEDDPHRAVQDLKAIRLESRDALVGIAASGWTPYTLGGMRYAKRIGSAVIGVTSNPQSSVRQLAAVAITPVVGPEVIAGSTRMKAGTAQKLVLNMLSTASMVRLGRVLSNRMINVQVRNRKLRRRACEILAKAARVSRPVAARVLRQSGDQLPVALLMLWSKRARRESEAALKRGPSVAAVLRAAEMEWKITSGLSRRRAQMR